MNLDDIKSRINALVLNLDVIQEKNLGIIHAYVIKYPDNGSIYSPLDVELKALTLDYTATNIASVDRLLSMSIIAYNNFKNNIVNDIDIERSLRKQLISIYEIRYHEDIGLIHTDKTRIYTTYNLEENYNYVLALNYIHASIPALANIARDMAKIICASVVAHMSQYSADDSPNNCYIVKKNNITGEYRRYNDDTYGLQRVYSLGFADLAEKMYGYRPNYILSPFERGVRALDHEVYAGHALYGQAEGYDRVNVSVDDNSERLEKRYPYRVSLKDNLKVAGLAYGGSYVLDIIANLTRLSDRASLNEFSELEMDSILEDQATLFYAWLWADNETFSHRINLPNTIPSSINVSPQAIPQRSLEDFSWKNMPTRWIKLKDKTTQAFHDAYIGGVGYAYKKLGNLNRDLTPSLAGEKTLNWLCFINGVPSDGIGILPRITKERLIGINRAILRKRNSHPAMRALNMATNRDLLRFEHYKPWQSINNTLYRHTNGGIWTLEIEPNIYTQNEIKRLWRVLQEGYTSARYLLVLSCLNVIVDTASDIYDSDKTYKKNDVVHLDGRYYRLLEDGNSDSPTDEEAIWKVVDNNDSYPQYKNNIEYKKGDKVRAGSRAYRLDAELVKGKSPLLSYTFWGVIERTAHSQGLFYSGMMHTNSEDSEMNSSLTHLSTAWRYPSSAYQDYSFRLVEEETLREDIYLGYLSGNMFYNSPDMTVILGRILRSSSDTLLNEGIPQWVNIIKELDETIGVEI